MYGTIYTSKIIINWQTNNDFDYELFLLILVTIILFFIFDRLDLTYEEILKRGLFSGDFFLLISLFTTTLFSLTYDKGTVYVA